MEKMIYWEQENAPYTVGRPEKEMSSADLSGLWLRGITVYSHDPESIFNEWAKLVFSISGQWSSLKSVSEKEIPQQIKMVALLLGS